MSRIATLVALTVVLFACVDATLFSTDIYRGFVDPASSTGTFERAIRRVDETLSDPARDVLVLGDSRIYAGLDPARAAAAAGDGLHFWNAGIPGSTPRTWAFFDPAIDPTARRFRAVVIPLDSYADDTSAIGSLDADDHPSDLRAIVFRVPLSDVATVASSLGEGKLQRAAALDLALRGPLLREDVADLLASPARRIAAIRAADPNAFDPAAAHPFPTHLDGLRVDFTTDTIAYPAAVPAAERAEIARQLLPIPHESRSYARYRERWLGAILARYRAAGVPVILVRIPTRPTHRSPPPPPPQGFVVDASAQPNVTVVPQDRYVALERPDLFADHDHLDGRGSAAFSELLGHDVAAALASHPPRAPLLRVPIPTGLAPDAPTAGGMHGMLAALGIGAPIAVQSFDYTIFLGLVALAFYAAPRRARVPLLLAVSYYFYARWNAWYVVLLAFITLCDFTIGLRLTRLDGLRRRFLLALGIGLNLAFLGTFKYLNFFTANVAAAFGLHDDPWLLSVLIPVGISFHSFQSISYLVDVANRRVEPMANLARYALYIAFFPQLLAGPIVRAGRFFTELEAWHAPDGARVERGLREILVGLVKKLAVADPFAAVADAYFANVSAYPGTAAAWTGVVAFAIQIYFDFSGYSDIAIGSARLLGFDFPENFRRPYLATSLTDFWHRWHITLSTWLRDYLFIPLGGSRVAAPLVLRNLMITMVLGGLWHGANWTFVAWGAYHGLLLCIERVTRSARMPARGPVERSLRTAMTVALVTLGWVFFRAASFGDARDVLLALFDFRAGAPALAASWQWAIVVAFFAVEIADERGAGWNAARIPLAMRASCAAGLLVVLELLSWPGASEPFVYFKF